MKILFIGSVLFSYETLKKTISLGGNVVGVVTLKESKFNNDFYDLTSVCEENNIPYIYSKDLNEKKSLNWIKNLNADILFCFGWSNLIPENILSLFPMKSIGFHPAALPANRGRHPIIWSLVLGLEETASTFFEMREKADSGPIISQKSIKILDEDNANTLYNKILKTAKRQIQEFLPSLIDGSIIPIEQSNINSNYWRKRNKKDGIIDWRMSAKSIKNLIRGLTYPYPGASFNFNNIEYLVWESEVIKNNNKNLEPGKILSFDPKGDIKIKCGEDAIILKKISPEIQLKVGDYL